MALIFNNSTSKPNLEDSDLAAWLLELEAALGEAADRLSSGTIPCLLVVEADRWVGVVCDRDILQQARQDAAWATRSVREVMGSPSPMVQLAEWEAATEADLRGWLHQMEAQQKNFLVIVDHQGRPRQVITERQICKQLSDLQSLMASQSASQAGLCRATLRELLDALQDNVFVLDRASGQITLANQAWARQVCHTTADRVEGTALQSCFPPDVAERFEQENQQVYETGEPLRIQEMVTLPTGDRVFDTLKVPLRNEQGEIGGLVGVARDITDLKATEQRLLQALADNTLLRQAIQSTPVGVALYDRQMRLQFANPALLDLLHCETLDQLFHQTLQRVFRELESTGLSPVVRALQRGESWQGELSSYRDEGERFVQEVSASPIYDDQGQLSGYLSLHQDITEKARLERTLRLTQFAMDRASDMVFWVRPDGRFVYVNQAACNVLGYSSVELLTRRVMDVDPNISEQRWQTYWQELKQQGFLRSESTNITKSGQEIPIEISASYIKVDGYEYKVSLLRDITRRKQAEAKLRHSEARYRLLAEHSRDMISRHQPDGTCLYVSPACRALTGYNPEELIGRRPIDFAHPDDLNVPGIQANFGSQDELVEELVYRFRCKNGSYVWLEFTLQVVTDDDTGQILELIAVGRDVTDRIAAQEALKVFDRAVNASNHGVVIFSGDSSELLILYANPAYQAMTGYAAEELRHLSFWQRVSPENDPETIAELRQGIAEQRSCLVNLRNFRKNGEAFWKRLSLSPVTNEQGQVTHWVSVQTDITENYQLQEELRLSAAQNELLLKEIHHRVKNRVVG